MSLAPGISIGHYDVTSLLGEGGMGQVWQATDTQLNRQVALKILPDAFADDPDRLARFTREAQILASLNHPNIAQIHGIEEAEGTRALVLELVEGPTLADRISQGAIPVDEALPIAKQIAEALEAAHEAGVIHRDLKPANIKVREDGTVKVLDVAPVGDPDRSPTLTAAATQMGVIMGTAAYMSPEQARGKPVDRRTDIWAFGAVLFEMLTASKPFPGDDISQTLARVIDREPDWDALPAGVPPSLETYLRRCLQKDPKQRVQAIGDVRLAMEGAFETSATASATALPAAPLEVWRRPIPLALVGLALVLTGALAAWTMMRSDGVPTGIVRFAIVAPEPMRIGAYRDIAISLDGRQVVHWSGPTAELAQLYLRPIDQLVGAPIRGTERAAGPFLSPDGTWVGFVDTVTGALAKVSIGGGSPVRLTDGARSVNGASWGADDQIVFGTRSSGLFRVSGGGGEPEALTTLDNEERGHMLPSVIPGRGAVIFTIRGGGTIADWQLAVVDLETREIRRLGITGVSARYVSTGHLLYADGALRAVPFDVATLTVVGSPVSLVEDVTIKPTGSANFGVSDNGRLVYTTNDGGGRRSLVWVDRDGREERIPVPVRPYNYPRLSPDGSKIALDIRDDEGGIWVWDFVRQNLQRLSFAPKSTGAPSGRRTGRASRSRIASPIRRTSTGSGRTAPARPSRSRRNRGRRSTLAASPRTAISSCSRPAPEASAREISTCSISRARRFRQ